MKLIEMIEVMLHYDNGGEVEFSEDNFETVMGKANKEDDGKLCWDWATYTYRINEPKQKVTIEKWLCRDKVGEYAVIDSSNVDKYTSYKKVKLMEIYEVEL